MMICRLMIAVFLLLAPISAKADHGGVLGIGSDCMHSSCGIGHASHHNHSKVYNALRSSMTGVCESNRRIKKVFSDAGFDVTHRRMWGTLTVKATGAVFKRFGLVENDGKAAARLVIKLSQLIEMLEEDGHC